MWRVCFDRSVGFTDVTLPSVNAHWFSLKNEATFTLACDGSGAVSAQSTSDDSVVFVSAHSGVKSVTIRDCQFDNTWSDTIFHIDMVCVKKYEEKKLFSFQNEKIIVIFRIIFFLK